MSLIKSFFYKIDNEKQIVFFLEDGDLTILFPEKKVFISPLKVIVDVGIFSTMYDSTHFKYRFEGDFIAIYNSSHKQYRVFDDNHCVIWGKDYEIEILLEFLKNE